MDRFRSECYGGVQIPEIRSNEDALCYGMVTYMLAIEVPRSFLKEWSHYRPAFELVLVMELFRLKPSIGVESKQNDKMKDQYKRLCELSLFSSSTPRQKLFQALNLVEDEWYQILQTLTFKYSEWLRLENFEKPDKVPLHAIVEAMIRSRDFIITISQQGSQWIPGLEFALSVWLMRNQGSKIGKLLASTMLESKLPLMAHSALRQAAFDLDSEEEDPSSSSELSDSSSVDESEDEAPAKSLSEMLGTISSFEISKKHGTKGESPGTTDIKESTMPMVITEAEEQRITDYMNLITEFVSKTSRTTGIDPYAMRLEKPTPSHDQQSGTSRDWSENPVTQSDLPQPTSSSSSLHPQVMSMDTPSETRLQDVPRLGQARSSFRQQR
jgi:hypothetical protein